MKLTVSLYTKL